MIVSTYPCLVVHVPQFVVVHLLVAHTRSHSSQNWLKGLREAPRRSVLTLNNDLPLPFSSFPKTSTALVSSLGDLDTFRPIGRVIPRAKCGDKTVRGIELLYMFYINRIALVNFLKETIQEFEANCTNHFKIACAHPIRTGHGDRSCTLHAVYECLPKRLDDHACFCFK